MANSDEVGRSVDVAGVATNYHDHGTGPVVLLIHGSGPGVSAWANWRTVIPELARDFRVIAPDILGFGYTERPVDVSYGPGPWLAHLIGFLDALDLPRVSVVGNSFGGSLALSLATSAPERVDRLALMGSVGVPFTITPGLEAVWGFEPSLAQMRTLLEVFTFDTASLGDDLAGMRLAAATRPGVQEAYARMFPAPRQRMVDGMVVAEDAIRALTQPTLLVHGRDDQVIPVANSLRLLDLIQDSQLHVFARCGHWVQIEQGRRFVRLLSDFLREPEQGPAVGAGAPVPAASSRRPLAVAGDPSRP